MEGYVIGFSIVAIAILIALFVVGLKWYNRPSRIMEKHAHAPDREDVFVKKYKEADIEAYRGIATRIGFIAVLGMLILVFNYSKTEKSDGKIYAFQEDEIIEQDIPVTNQVAPKLPPPPPPPPQIVIVKDERVIESEPEFEVAEIGLDDEIEIYEDTSSTVEVEVPALPDYTESDETEIFMVVEQQPEYPGGPGALMDYLSTNISYPPLALENSIEGTVVLRFVVSETGGISDINILKEIGGGCGEEAVRVVREMPQWQPGYQRGKAVKVYFTLPVRFKLQ